MYSREEIYLAEMRSQADYALKAFESFEFALNAANVSDVFYHLHHFLVHAICIEKILRDNARRDVVARTVNLNGADFEPFRPLRNHLEHFDERLDQWLDQYLELPFFDMNIVTGATGFREHKYLRAVDGTKFLFFGEEYDLSILRNVIVRLLRELDSRNMSGNPND